MKLFRRFMSDKKVEKKYVFAGANFGDAVSYIYMGECIGFKSLLKKWAGWEKEYAKRGYRNVSLDDFVGLGGRGKSIDNVLGKKREENEEPIFHAQIYRDEYLGKIASMVDFNGMLNGEIKAQCATYFLPSTKDFSE